MRAQTLLLLCTMVMQIFWKYLSTHQADKKMRKSIVVAFAVAVAAFVIIGTSNVTLTY